MSQHEVGVSALKMRVRAPRRMRELLSECTMRDERPKLNDLARVARVRAREPSFDARVMDAVRALPRHTRFGLWSTHHAAPPHRDRHAAIVGPAAASIRLFALLGVAHAYVDVNRAAKPLVAAFGGGSKKATPPQRVQFGAGGARCQEGRGRRRFQWLDSQHARYQAQHRGGGVVTVTAPIPSVTTATRSS